MSNGAAQQAIELSDEAFLAQETGFEQGVVDTEGAGDDGDERVFYGDSIFENAGPETDGFDDGSAESADAADGNDGSEADDADDDSELDPEGVDDESAGDAEQAGDEDPDDSDSDSDEDGDKEKDDGEEQDDAVAQAKAFMEQITAPFKANGREMQVTDPQDVIRLMQMGANYNRKMGAMKPHLKVLKMLERNELLDPDKLNFLIDLDKKNPEAIKKLVRDAELDPLDLRVEDDLKYEAPKHEVTDEELALDEVVEEIRDTPTYSKTLDVVSNQWDANSRKIVAGTPQLLRVINDHVASGIYDRISTEVTRERTLGRLAGLNDIEAYKTVGDALHAKGAFDDLTGETSVQGEKTPKAETANTQPKPRQNSQRRERRRAAGATKPAADAPVRQDFNPLALSDEEYLKQLDDRFM